MFVQSFYELLEDSIMNNTHILEHLHGVSGNVAIMGLLLLTRGVSLLVVESPSGVDLKTLDLFCVESALAFDEDVLLFNLLII